MIPSAVVASNITAIIDKRVVRFIFSPLVLHNPGYLCDISANHPGEGVDLLEKGLGCTLPE